MDAPSAPTFATAQPLEAPSEETSRAPFPKADVPRRLMAAALDEGLVMLVLSVVSVGALGTAYFIGQDCIGGQSVGRRVAKQFLVDDETGQIADPTKAAMRNLVGFLFALTTIGILIDFGLLLYRPDGKRVADILLKTQVVDAAALERSEEPEAAPTPTVQTF